MAADLMCSVTTADTAPSLGLSRPAHSSTGSADADNADVTSHQTSEAVLCDVSGRRRLDMPAVLLSVCVCVCVCVCLCV